MSLDLTERERYLIDQAVGRLGDLDLVKVILQADFCAKEFTGDRVRVNSYERERMLWSAIAPLCYFFFSNKVGNYSHKNTKASIDDLECFLRSWLVPTNFSWKLMGLIHGNSEKKAVAEKLNMTERVN